MAVGYGIIMRIQDCFFYIFEIGEFHHYGRVALLDPPIKSTLIQLQTSL